MATAQQEADARALLAKGNQLGQQASAQTGVAFSPSPSGQAASPGVQQVTTPTGSLRGAGTKYSVDDLHKKYGLSIDEVQYLEGRGNPTWEPTRDLSMYAGSVPSSSQPQQTQTTTPQQTNPTQPTTAQQPTQSSASPQTQQAAATLQPMGSIVDTLKMAGMDSSFAARQQLAAQYGIQGYTGTAAQNTSLEKKFVDAFNASKGTVAPNSPAEARSALQTLMDAQGTAVDPMQDFYSAYGSMDPITASLFDQMNSLLSAQSNQKTFTEIYAEEMAKQGVPGLQMELADINRIIEGTEDDIRAEVTAAGGFATESQVAALTNARNKTLIKRATYLSDVIAAKNDYVNTIVSLTKADRDQVNQDIERKLGITKMMFDMQQQMQSAARENYARIIDTVGWAGLAASARGNPQQTARIESLLGLAPGELEALGNYTKPLTEMEKLEIENAQLQNKRLRMELSGGGGTNLQFVAATGNQPGGVFNPKTGVFTPLTGTQDNTMRLATAQSNIGSIESLLKNGSLDAAVATNKLGSYSFPNLFTAGKSNFIAGVEQLRTQLTLDNLINAKANGATFGALSEGELQLLNASASKMGSWAQKDSAGNVLYYKTSEKAFKEELDKINYFAKLDYLLKGGDPTSVGVTQQADGTFWMKNSNGTYTQLK